MVRILHDGWSFRLGENRSDQPLRHLAVMLFVLLFGSRLYFVFALIK